MGPLRGYRVVEIGIWVAGPAAASMLADWGADVIKVEPPAGDPNRYTLRHIGIDAISPAFALDNRGKRSVVLDLKADERRAHFDRLLADADVLVTNLRPAALQRLGLDPASCCWTCELSHCVREARVGGEPRGSRRQVVRCEHGELRVGR
jgi:crotonobetainyl-CoA:carnitine CoA-transferase CaiB-like acyl-CoA transferase